VGTSARQGEHARGASSGTCTRTARKQGRRKGKEERRRKEEKKRNRRRREKKGRKRKEERGGIRGGLSRVGDRQPSGTGWDGGEEKERERERERGSVGRKGRRK